VFCRDGNRVTCVDIDSVKIEKLNQGIIPIFEPGLETMVLKNVKNKNLFFTTALNEALQNAEIAFIAVGNSYGR
jgi:UDPglucose 6-dehydrogenase